MNLIGAHGCCRWLVLAGLVTALHGCGKQAPAPEASAPAHDGVIRVATTPVGYLAQRIAGDSAEVVVMVPDDADPAFWQPGFDVIGEFQGSMLIVLNGAGFERWADTAALPTSRVVRTAEAGGVALIESEVAVHTHGTEGEHSHGETNPHTWMSPAAAMAQAQAIADALMREKPMVTASINDRHGALALDLADLSERWAGVDVSGVRLVASHPSYDYLAREMGWEIINIDLPPEGPIADEQVTSLIGVAEEDERTVLVLWESEPDEAIARQLLDDYAIHSVVIRPGEAGPIDGYLELMRANVEQLKDATARARGE